MKKYIVKNEVLNKMQKLPKLLSWLIAPAPILFSNLSTRRIPAAIRPMESTSDLHKKARYLSSALVTTASICQIHKLLYYTKQGDRNQRTNLQNFCTGCLTENFKFSTIHFPNPSSISSSQFTMSTSMFIPPNLSAVSLRGPSGLSCLILCGERGFKICRPSIPTCSSS